MRRPLLGLGLALAACGAPPAPPAPAPPPPARAVVAPAPRVSVSLEGGVVIARDGAGKERFRIKIKGAHDVAPAPGGGAYVVTGAHLLRLDEGGAERWKAEVKRSGKLLGGRSLVMVSSSSRVHVFDADDGADRGVTFADEGGVTHEGHAPARSWQVPLRLFPGSPGARADRVMAVGADGLVLAGASDGSLVAIDPDGKPRFQLGVRGAVSAIEARPTGGFVVTTQAGAVIVHPNEPAPTEPPPRPPATLAYRARLASGQPTPQLALAPDDLWSLETRFGPDVREQRLHRFDGKTWRRISMPQLDVMSNPILTGASEFEAYRLARGPNGQLLVIGLQQVWSKVYPAMASIELRVFERAGSAFRERPDLKAAFAKTNQHIESNPGAPSYAVGPGGREAFCAVDACLARGLSPSFRPEKGGAAPVPAGAPPWVFFEWPDASMWWERRPMVFAGETLWRLDARGLHRGGDLVLEGMPTAQIEREFGTITNSHVAIRALWASGENDVWAVMGYSQHGTITMRWDGKGLSRVPIPLRWADAVWGSGPDDVWIAGEGVAHFDGKEWRRIAGVPGGPITGVGRGDVWIGPWHVTSDPSAQPDLEGAPAPVPPVSAPSRALEVGAVEPSIRLEPVALDVAGDVPLKTAVGVAEGSGGVVWLHDPHRIVEYDGAGARVLYRAPAAEPLACQRCVAPRAGGEGHFLARGPDEMVALRSMSGSSDVGALPALLSIARAPDGAVWAVSASDDDGSPRAIVLGAAGLRLVAGLPPAAYADVAPRAADDVWLAGGLGTSRDNMRVWPAGEGTLAHFDGRRFVRHRAPDGALLSVASVAAAEAWAVGLDGGVVRAKGESIQAFHLEREGAPLRVALRAVAANGPDDVWMAGDRATLLWWDGKALRRVDTRAAGSDAAFTGVIAPRDRPGWVVGPSGVWRIVRPGVNR